MCSVDGGHTVGQRQVQCGDGRRRGIRGHIVDNYIIGHRHEVQVGQGSRVRNSTQTINPLAIHGNSNQNADVVLPGQAVNGNVDPGNRVSPHSSDESRLRTTIAASYYHRRPSASYCHRGART